MILTECTECDEGFWFPYEAGDPGCGGFAEHVCEKCGAKNYVQLLSIGGKTYSEKAFREKFIDKGKVKFEGKKKFGGHRD